MVMADIGNKNYRNEKGGGTISEFPEKRGYVLEKKEYENLFYMKYSFYSLMRRIHNWFVLNQTSDELRKGFLQFKLYVSGDEKDEKNNKFTFKRMGMFFSDEFLNENMYVSGKYGISEAMKSDYKGKKIRNINITSKPKKQNWTNKVSFQSNSWWSIFCKQVSSNSIVKSYRDIILNDSLFEKEEKRVASLVKKWFPTEHIRKKIIDEVLEKEFFSRKLVSIPGNTPVNLKEKGEVYPYDIIYLNEDFFQMVNTLIKNKKCDKNKVAIFNSEEYTRVGLKSLGIYEEGNAFNQQKSEERINDFFDELESDQKTIGLDKNRKLKKLDGIYEKKRYTFEYEKLIRKQFDICKNNTTKFIADVIITSLCLTDLENVLKIIWGCKFTKKDIISGDFTDNTIKTICLYPLISMDNLIEELEEFAKEKPDFYNTEYSFINFLYYECWEEVSKSIVGINSKEKLLLEFYDFYKNYIFDEDVENEKTQIIYKKYDADNYINKSLWLCANMILDFHMSDYYKEIECIIETLSCKIELKDERMLYAKYEMIVNENYEEAYRYSLEIYRSSLEEGIIATYILPCLEKIKDEKNASDFCFEGKDINESIEFWSEIRNFNGDASAIRQKWSEKSRRELEDRINVLKQKYNDLDMNVNIHKARKSISIKDKTKDIYIVLGFSEKAQAFVDSIVDKIDVEIKLVLQRNEMNKLYFLEEWYKNTNIEIVNTDIIEIISELELYNLWDGFNEDPLRFKNYCENNVKKIHFLALGDNKSDNLTSVITIINETWKRYVMYRILEPITDYKIDFSEIDIIVDSMPTTPWYLDSIINRFEDDFYIKINSYSEYDLAIRELLMEYPLFLSDLNNKNNEARHDILVLGDNKIIPDIIKNILMVNGFMRSDKITKQHLTAAAAYKYEDFEQNICSDSSLYIVDKNASVIRDKILCDCPDIFKDRDYVHCKPQFYDLDIFGYKFHQLFGVLSKDELYVNRLESITDLEQKIQLELYDIVRNANYIIIATDNEEESIALSMKIREYRYRWNIQDEPVISVYTPESNIDENINEFTIGKETYGSAWHRNYHINMFGKRRKIYSKEYLYENYFNVISHELHMDDDYKKREQKEKDYYKVVYNRKSCDARTIAVPYVMYSVLGEYMVKDFTLSANHKMGINKWSMDIFCDFIDNYLTKYHSIVGDEKSRGIHPGWREIIACLEHHRWNYWMMAVQGYSSSPFGDETMQYVKDTIRSWAERTTEITKDNEKNAVRDNKLYIAKMHFAIRTFDSLGEPEDIQGDACGFEKTMLELHDEKGVTEGMSTTKNRKYDRKYAMEMVSSLARAFNIRSYNDKSR